MKALQLKYKAKQLLGRFRPTRQFKYKYRASSISSKAREYAVSKNKQISIASIVIFLLFVSFVVTNSVTGYVAYQKGVETELNETKNILSETESELSTVTAAKSSCESMLQDKEAEVTLCNDKLNQRESYLMECENERNELRAYTNELNAQFAECEELREEFQTKYEDIDMRFNELVKKTAFDVCCRPGIEIANWGISDDRIVCSGEFTVDCSSGETNY